MENSGVIGVQAFCVLIGDPVGHSLSPCMHTAGYQALGIEQRFEYRALRVAAADLATTLTELRSRGVRGVSCTMPHKQAVIELLDEVDDAARRIGAVNTVLNNEGRLIGLNTDADGVVQPLLRRVELSGRRAAVLGAGGAARAAVCGLCGAGAEVTIFNRSPQRARKLAEEFKCGAGELSAGCTTDFDLVLNMTSVGMGATQCESPLPGALFRPEQIVFDAVYRPELTRLLSEAQSAGAQIIPGIEMLVAQGAEQFRLFTGSEPPLAAMEAAVRAALAGTEESPR